MSYELKHPEKNQTNQENLLNIQTDDTMFDFFSGNFLADPYDRS